MRQWTFLAVFIILFSSLCLAQTKQLELSGHYAALNNGLEHAHGFGMQASYDFAHRLGIDSGITFYPSRDNLDITLQGSQVEVGAGVRVAVLRTRKIGMFARVRPGLLHLSELQFNQAGVGTVPGLSIRHDAQTNFALDFGGTVEFYPTRHTFIRADFGDLYVRRGTLRVQTSVATVPPEVFDIEVPAHGQHQYKVSFGAGWRFGSASPDRFGNNVAESERRWTLGTQYSTLYIDGWRSGVGATVTRRISDFVEWGAVTNVFPGGNAGPDSFLWTDQRILQFQTGPAVQLVGGRIVSLKAHLRPGLLNYGDYIVFGMTGPESVGSQTEFDLNYGIAAEFNAWKRVPVRLEVSDNLIKHSDVGGRIPSVLANWDHAPQVSIGIGFRF